MKLNIAPMKLVSRNVPLPMNQKRIVVWLRFCGQISRTTIRMPSDWFPDTSTIVAEDLELADGSLVRVWWPKGFNHAEPTLGAGECVNLDDEVCE